MLREDDVLREDNADNLNEVRFTARKIVTKIAAQL